MSSHDNSDDASGKPAVLDPAWEDALRAGQAAEGLSGSVEPELAIVHLIRHARAVEPLRDAGLDRVWGSIDQGLDAAAPVPWWRRPFTWIGGTTVVAAAAAVVLVIVISPRAPDGGSTGGGEAIADARARADALEAQFQILAPAARERVAARVDLGRGRLREGLLAEAMKSGQGGTLGGAP